MPENYIQYLEALANEDRIKILKMLTGKSLCVQDIAQYIYLSRPTISYHLLLLKKLGLVKNSKNGKERYYSTNMGIVKECLKKLLHEFKLLYGKEECISCVMSVSGN